MSGWRLDPRHRRVVYGAIMTMQQQIITALHERISTLELALAKTEACLTDLLQRGTSEHIRARHAIEYARVVLDWDSKEAGHDD